MSRSLGGVEKTSEKLIVYQFVLASDWLPCITIIVDFFRNLSHDWVREESKAVEELWLLFNESFKLISRLNLIPAAKCQTGDQFSSSGASVSQNQLHQVSFFAN